MTTESASPPNSGAEAPKARAASRLLPLVLALAVGAGAAGSFPLWRAKLGLPAPEAEESFEAENLRAELSAAASRIAQLEAAGRAAEAKADAASSSPSSAAPSASSSPSASSGASLAEIESLAKQLADLRRSSADAGAVLKLAERVEAAEAAIRELQARRASAATLLLAVGQLREAVAMGRPFEPEWRAARALAGEDGESVALLDQLKPGAETGIAPRATLLGRLDALAPAIIRAAILPEEDSWWRGMAGRLLALVTIRREDGAALGDHATARVGRAQAQAARGDLAATLAELEPLSGSGGAAAAGWVAEARARITADKATGQLVAQAIALAGAGSHGGGPK